MRHLAIITTLLLAPAVVPAAVLDFEGLTVGSLLTTEFQSSDSIVFLENARVYHLGGGHATSGVLGLYNSGATISAEFRLAGGAAAVTSMVSVKGDQIPIAGNVILEAYDVNGNLIGSDVEPDSPAPATLTISAAGIHRIRLFAQSGTVAFDDLSFTTPIGADTSAIPEPGSIALSLIGLAGLVSLRRFRGNRTNR